MEREKVTVRTTDVIDIFITKEICVVRELGMIMYIEEKGCLLSSYVCHILMSNNLKGRIFII